MTARNATTKTDSRLQLEPPSARTRFIFFLLCVVMPAGLSTVAMTLSGNDDMFGHPMADIMVPTRLAGPLLVTAFAVVLWLLLDWAMRRHRLSLDDGALTVTSSFYKDRVALSDLQLDQARVIDIDEHPERKPLLKSNGYSLPGFNSGWFRSRKFKKLFVATAGGKRLLWLPTTRGHILLLQPRNPKALLDRLHELSEQHPPL